VPQIHWQVWSCGCRPIGAEALRLIASKLTIHDGRRPTKETISDVVVEQISSVNMTDLRIIGLWWPSAILLVGGDVTVQASVMEHLAQQRQSIGGQRPLHNSRRRLAFANKHQS